MLIIISNSLSQGKETQRASKLPHTVIQLVKQTTTVTNYLNKLLNLFD